MVESMGTMKTSPSLTCPLALILPMPRRIQLFHLSERQRNIKNSLQHLTTEPFNRLVRSTESRYRDYDPLERRKQTKCEDRRKVPGHIRGEQEPELWRRRDRNYLYGSHAACESAEVHREERDTMRRRDRRCPFVSGDTSESDSDEVVEWQDKMREEDEARRAIEDERRAARKYHERAIRQRTDAFEGNYSDERARKMFAASAAVSATLMMVISLCYG